MDELSDLQKLADQLLWRPMDSAPMDGTKILVHMLGNDDLGPIIVRWDENNGIWEVPWDGTDICKDWSDEPICWMPIQPPPTRIKDR